jgi:hypothetical protein
MVRNRENRLAAAGRGSRIFVPPLFRLHPRCNIGVMSDGTLSDEQQVALDHFVNLTEVMKRRQQQVEDLGVERRRAAQTLRDLDVPVTVMAKSAKIGPQAIYKLLSSAER